MNDTESEQFWHSAVPEVPWSSEHLLRDVSAGHIKLSSKERRASEGLLWRSICSEHDARHFFRQLITVGPPLPWKMQEFLAGWFADEVNHARGFKILYEKIYGLPPDEIEERLASRLIDFSHLAEFFGSLFSVCILFAFDELVTTHVYEMSIGFFRQWGIPTVTEWSRRLVRDEARHYRTVMGIVREYCAAEAPLAEDLLARVIDVDLAQTDYHGTFVLDHTCAEFPFNRDDLVRMSRRAIVNGLTWSPGARGK
jgi:hypothetical protein